MDWQKVHFKFTVNLLSDVQLASGSCAISMLYIHCQFFKFDRAIRNDFNVAAVVCQATHG